MRCTEAMRGELAFAAMENSSLKTFPTINVAANARHYSKLSSIAMSLSVNIHLLTRKEFSNITRSNNTSGITGVYRYAKPYYLKDGKKRENWYWEGHWPTTIDGCEHVAFSVKDYGEEKARSLTIALSSNKCN